MAGPTRTIKTIVKRGRPYYIWRWRDDHGNWREKSSGIRIGRGQRAKAEAAAKKHAQELEWPAFWSRYSDEVLSQRSDGYRGVMRAAVAAAQELGVETIQDIDAALISKLAARLSKDYSRSTVTSYIKHLLAMRRWAYRVGICFDDVVLPPGLTHASESRREPPSDAELQRALAAVRRVRPDDHKRWRWIVRGLWASGLRLGESYRLTWDGGLFAVDMAADPPIYRIDAAGQKSKRQQLLPVVPEFAEMLHARRHRQGLVFPWNVKQDQGGKVIRRIFSEAGLPYSAHDLRRAFATRWASRLMPADLQALMRHRSIETTLRYYVRAQADDLAAKLYQAGGGFGGG